jgi:hypothetical protein
VKYCAKLPRQRSLKERFGLQWMVSFRNDREQHSMIDQRLRLLVPRFVANDVLSPRLSLVTETFLVSGDEN